MTTQDRNFETATRYHETMHRSGADGFKVVVETGASSLRLLSTINAGGLIALLGFLGAVIGKEHKPFSDVTPFITPMTEFGLGLAASVVAVCAMYFAQFFYARSHEKLRYDFVHPYAHQTESSKRNRRAGITFHVLTVLFAIASLTFFLCASFGCLALLRAAKL